MKAVRLHKFHTQPVIDDVPEPKISGPLDVIGTSDAGVLSEDLGAACLAALQIPRAAARQHSLFGTPGDETSLRAASARAVRIMDDHMTARGFTQLEWFAAGHPTIADIALFPAFALSRDFGIDHDEYPALRRWARRFRALPGFKTMPGIPDYH